MNLDYQIKLNEPYPKIEGAIADPTTVGVLKNLAFSKSGELSAVLTYIFNSNIADKTDEDVGKLFEEICMLFAHLAACLNTKMNLAHILTRQACNTQQS